MFHALHLLVSSPPAMSCSLPPRNPNHFGTLSPAQTVSPPKRRHRSSSGRKRGNRSLRMSDAERAEEARLGAALRYHEVVRQSYERYPFTVGSPGINELFWGGIALYLLAAATPVVALALAAEIAAFGFRTVRVQAYRARAGVDRAFARKCAARLREARNASPGEYRRVLRILATERETREAEREREALALSSQPAAAKRRATARAKRDLAWQDWFRMLERTVAESGSPPRDPGLPQFPERPPRRGAPVRKLCAFSIKEAPTGTQVREQFEKARGRGRVEEKIRLGSMLLDAEATVDSSLVRNGDGEIVGRNAGLRGWIIDNCPELLPHYATLTGYRRLAWETRESEEVADPIPASLLLGPEPTIEAKVPPVRWAKIEPARNDLRRLLKEPDSATMSGFLRRMRAERIERERAQQSRRQLA